MGHRKIYVGEGMKAKDAWKRLSEDSQNWPVPEGTDEGRLNSAYIQVVKEIRKKAVFIFMCYENYDC